MFREVACYRTLKHSGIPKLIESNAERYEERDIPLYLVTELVPGIDLGKHVSIHGAPETRVSLEIVDQLLGIISYTHGQDAVHRDIKPENVMLHSISPVKVHLVDFGLSFLGTEHSDDDHSTALGQELGNRFLRLPEYGVNSTRKRDTRSDVTQCAGLLFFLLTGMRPSLLEDEGRRRPHQRVAARDRLSKHTEIDLPALLNVFDRAFEIEIDARWQSADHLREALFKIGRISRPMPGSQSRDELIAAIRTQMDSHLESQAKREAEYLTGVGAVMKAARDELSHTLPDFVDSSSGPGIDIKKRQVIAMLGLVKRIDHSVGPKPVFVGILLGPELIVRLQDGSKILFRCEQPEFNAKHHELKAAIQSHLLTELASIIIS